MNKIEIWAIFPDGIKAKVETHKNAKTAQAAVDAMEWKNQNDSKIGYGFPHGLPRYENIERA